MVLGALHLKEHHIKNITIKNRNLLLREKMKAVHMEQPFYYRKVIYNMTQGRRRFLWSVEVKKEDNIL